MHLTHPISPIFLCFFPPLTLYLFPPSYSVYRSSFVYFAIKPCFSWHSFNILGPEPTINVTCLYLLGSLQYDFVSSAKKLAADAVEKAKEASK